MGVIVNLLIRLSIFYFLGEVLLFPDDPRFAGKAIPIRNFIIVITLSLLFPILYFWKKKWKKYPFWFDNLYLSLFWLDMAGNSLNLYDTYFFFDLLPHFHGTGAFSAALFGAFGLPAGISIMLANIVHALLEAQEYFTDVFFGTHNVRGTFDIVNDLLVGFIGASVYPFISKRLQKVLFVLIITVLLTLFFHQQVATHIKALLFISQEFSYIPTKPLHLLSKPPTQKQIELSRGEEKIIADLFVPTQWFETAKKPQHSAIILAMGVRTQEKDKPIIRNFANSLSRLGYVVLWPRREILDKGVASYERPETFIAGFDYLSTLEAVNKKRISFVGFSVGSSTAFVAAADSRIAEKVHGFVFFGGYYDLFDYLASLTSNTTMLNNKKITWQPENGAVSHAEEILKEEQVDRVILKSLNPKERLSNFKARIFILHDRNDSYVPYVESIKLQQALPKDKIGSFVLVDLFAHVQPKKTISMFTIGEVIKLYQFLFAVFSYF